MKVSTLTFQESHNYGALLQAYALQTKLGMMGCEVEIINYHSEQKASHYGFGYDKNRSILANISKQLSRGLRKKRMRQMDAFRRDYLKLTKERYDTREALSSYAQTRDYIICGSDQIWNYNSIKGDSTYLLDFVTDPSRKIAYAPSFGTSSIPNEQKDFYIRNLTNFEKLSVREKTGAEIIRDLMGKEVPVVADPCMLLETEEWRKLSMPIENKKLSNGFIFVYYIRYSPELIAAAKKASEETGLPVVISAHSLLDLKNGFQNICLSVPQFLWAVGNAKMVFTNSFHATLFSIVFEKDVHIFPDKREKNNTSSRIFGLLESLGLNTSGDLTFHPDDYDDAVHSRMEQERGRANKYIRQVLEIESVE